MEQVAPRWARGEPSYRVTRIGLEQLWELVGTDRLAMSERTALCLALTELEGSRRARLAHCAGTR